MPEIMLKLNAENSLAGSARQAELEQRIVTVMNTNRGFRANQLADCIMVEFDAIASPTPRDGVTLVILERQ